MKKKNRVRLTCLNCGKEYNDNGRSLLFRMFEGRKVYYCLNCKDTQFKATKLTNTGRVKQPSRRNRNK